MVGYDSQNNALTLGDDDSLKVGEYELQYDSTSDEFQAEYEPTGDTKSIPRSTSGSLVPQGFADVLSQGEVLADNGEIYTSVQTAVNNSSGFVFIGPGTFNESVKITTEGLTLEGSGHDTLIDGGTSGTNAVNISATDVTVRNLSAQTTPGSGTNLSSFQINSDRGTLENCHSRQSDQHSFYIRNATDSIVQNCTEENADERSVQIEGERALVMNNHVSGYIRTIADDGIISGNIVANSNIDGIVIAGNDNTVGGNRVFGSANDNIRISGVDNIIYNNRCSDAVEDDLDDIGTGTLLDGNLTGPSN